MANAAAGGSDISFPVSASILLAGFGARLLADAFETEHPRTHHNRDVIGFVYAYEGATSAECHRILPPPLLIPGACASVTKATTKMLAPLHITQSIPHQTRAN